MSRHESKRMRSSHEEIEDATVVVEVEAFGF